jgi:hypothetical protein
MGNLLLGDGKGVIVIEEDKYWRRVFLCVGSAPELFNGGVYWVPCPVDV